ncbi:MAG: DUF1638 domain-containing protein, partial [Caldilineaceae bacterium]|nr:DUF1638 domain-containing protein [Caldilineaceae bacterium]
MDRRRDQVPSDKVLCEQGLDLPAPAPARLLLIACGALAHEVTALIRANGWNHMDLKCLPANLHLHPERITGRVAELVERHRAEYPQIFVLYADCGTGGLLERKCAELGVGMLRGPHCYAFYEGVDAFARHDDEVTAFYLTDFLARQFDAFVWKPMGLDRHPELLEMYFGNYTTKIRWILDQDPALAARAGRGELAFATIDGFLIHRLTGGQAHAVDVTNASRTLLCELRTMTWSDELCGLLGVPRELLPTVVPSSGTIGVTRGVPGLPDGVPICGVAGDQQAALFGQACFEPGDAKCTFGTGAFILMNTGTEPVPSHAGLVTTVAWKLGDGEVAYALEGSAFIAGAAVQWLRDGLGLIGSAAEIEALARSVPDAGGVVVVPAFTGLGAPHWRPEARGLISGLTRGTTRAHLARATLEGIALQNVDILRAME